QVRDPIQPAVRYRSPRPTRLQIGIPVGSRRVSTPSAITRIRAGPPRPATSMKAAHINPRAVTAACSHEYTRKGPRGPRMGQTCPRGSEVIGEHLERSEPVAACPAGRGAQVRSTRPDLPPPQRLHRAP